MNISLMSPMNNKRCRLLPAVV